MKKILLILLMVGSFVSKGQLKPYTVVRATDSGIVKGKLVDNAGREFGPSARANATVYLDATYGNDTAAAIDNPAKPFATIDAALDATTGPVVIRLSAGTFTAPTEEKMRSDLSFIGSGKPSHNGAFSTTSYATFNNTLPTKLVGGTIIRGKIGALDVNNLRFENLGVDVGKEYVDSGGTPSDGIAIGTSNTVFPFTLVRDIVYKNIIVLGDTSTSLFHCVLTENGYQTLYDGVETINNVYGIAEKGIEGRIINTVHRAHGWSAIIVKSDALANNYGTTIDNAHISSILPYDCAGIVIQSASGANAVTSVSNCHIIGAMFGVKTDGAQVDGNQAISISNNVIDSVSTIGVQIENGINYTVKGNVVSGAAVQGYQVIGAIGYGIFSANLAIGCGINGFEISTVGRIDFESNVAVNNTVYGFNFYTPDVTYMGSYTAFGNGVANLSDTFQLRNPPAVIDQSILIATEMPATDNKYIDSDDDSTLFYRAGSRYFEVAIVRSFEAINFETVTDIYEPFPRQWQNATGGGYGHTGLSSTVFAGDGRLAFWGSSHSGLLGLNTDSLEVGYADMEVMIGLNSAGQLDYKDGASIVSTGITIAASDIVAIYREESTFKVQRSTDDGLTWTDIAPLLFSTADPLHIVTDIAGTAIDPAGGVLFKPTFFGGHALGQYIENQNDQKQTANAWIDTLTLDGNIIVNGAIAVTTPATGANTDASVVWNATDKLFKTVTPGQLPVYTEAQRNSLTPTAGQKIYCTDCTAADGSTGADQTWNGTIWKSAW